MHTHTRNSKPFMSFNVSFIYFWVFVLFTIESLLVLTKSKFFLTLYTSNDLGFDLSRNNWESPSQ